MESINQFQNLAALRIVMQYLAVVIEVLLIVLLILLILLLGRRLFQKR